MYTIYIALDLPNIPQEKQDSMLSQHRAWFKKYFDEGIFLMVGPCPDALSLMYIMQTNWQRMIFENSKCACSMSALKTMWSNCFLQAV